MKESKVDDLPKEGDICETCLTRWEKKNLPGKVLLKLPTTTELGIPVIVCPFCDGTPIISMSNMPDNKFISDEEE